MAVEAEGTLITVHEASVQDHDGAPDVILAMLEKARQVATLWADGSDQGPKLASRREKLNLRSLLTIVDKSRETRGLTALYRRWVVKRTFAKLSQSRCLARDDERSFESAAPWAQLATCCFLMRQVARDTTA